jgi:uncharacterized protein (TIGR03083 family)
VTHPIDHAEWLRRLDSATAGFTAMLGSADLTRPVPGCPGWNLADLAAHLGGVHAWAEHAVVAGNPNLVGEPAPTEHRALSRWYADRAGSLLATRSATDPEAPAWAFSAENGRAGFWVRRQTHETTIHLWDAASSQGDDLTVDPALAVDGIDEITTAVFPRQLRLGRTTPLRQPVAFEPTDADVPPIVLGDGAGEADRDGRAATVHGPAGLLLLLLWKRVGADDERLVITGDRAAYLELLTHALTP